MPTLLDKITLLSQQRAQQCHHPSRALPALSRAHLRHDRAQHLVSHRGPAPETHSTLPPSAGSESRHKPCETCLTRRSSRSRTPSDSRPSPYISDDAVDGEPSRGLSSLERRVLLVASTSPLRSFTVIAAASSEVPVCQARRRRRRAFEGRDATNLETVNWAPPFFGPWERRHRVARPRYTSGISSFVTNRE